MLIAALAAFFLFWSHSAVLTTPLDQIATLIRKDVPDEARRKQALGIVDQMKAVINANQKQRKISAEELDALLSKRQTPVSEIEHAAQSVVADYEASSDKLLDLRFQLKSVLTRSEWVMVFPAPRPADKKKST